MQAVCDASLKFLDIVARWPGSVHDSTIFNSSRLKARLLNREFGNGILLGDSGYACTSYLLTPLIATHNRAEELYNESQIRTRNVIERCFGVWKRRFPALAYGMRTQIPTTLGAIVAAAVLQNIARDRREPDPPVDDHLEVILQELGDVGLNDVFDNHDNLRQSMINTYFTG